MKKPFINWDELAQLARPPLPPKDGRGHKGPHSGEPHPGGPHSGLGGWDNQSGFYNQMAKMEKSFTLNQLNCFDTSPEDTVLDVGCGPGRITVPMAKRAKSVTSVDASPKMLEFCRQNALAEGLTNVNTMLIDWTDDKALDNLEKHDIVIASRSVGMGDLMKLSSMAKKYTVLIIWSHGFPNIPVISGYLFEGTEGPDERPRHFHPMHGRDRRLGNNLLYNRVYDLGFNPNLKIVDDGFTKDFASREEAYDDLRRLRPSLADDKIPVFKANVDKFLTENLDGTVTYLCKTKTVVLWWKPELEE